MDFSKGDINKTDTFVTILLFKNICLLRPKSYTTTIWLSWQGFMVLCYHFSPEVLEPVGRAPLRFGPCHYGFLKLRFNSSCYKNPGMFLNEGRLGISRLTYVP